MADIAELNEVDDESISTVNGIARANISEINGVAIPAAASGSDEEAILIVIGD